MKRFAVCALTIAVLLSLCACRIVDEALTDKSKLASMELTDGGTLLWGDKVYAFYGMIPDDSVIGEWFGRIENQDYMRVYLCENQEPKKWLIVLDSTTMGTYALYKESAVTDIPDRYYEKSWDNIANESTSDAD